MKRLFWIGVGVGVTVVVIRKGQQLRARYSPPALVGRATRDLGARLDGLGARVVAAGRGFGDDLRAAMTDREAQLRAGILSPGQPSADEVGDRVGGLDWGARGRHAAGAEYPGRVSGLDDDGDEDLPYSF